MIETFSAVVFHNISETWGSGPLVCTLSNEHRYYCKKNNKTTPPLTDLINEVLMNKILTEWKINCPEICLVEFDYSMFENELIETINKLIEKAKARNINYKNTYLQNRFNHVIFGSKVIQNQIGLSGTAHASAFDISNFTNPIDILKIGFFDLWISNKDRKPSNSNLIYISNSDNKFDIFAIDNCQAFYNLPNYTNLLNNASILSTNESILNCGFAQQVINSSTKQSMDKLIATFDILIIESLKILPSIFETIPVDWGLNVDDKNEITSFLENENRIKSIIKTFKEYINYENLL